MYAASTDLVQAYGQDTITRLSTASDCADPAAVIQGALTYATAIIDTQLSVRFPLPLPTIPQRLVDIAVDLAAERMANSADLLTDIISDRAKRARTDLRDISEGRLHLGLPAKSPTDSPRPVIGRVHAGINKLFDRRRLRSE